MTAFDILKRLCDEQGISVNTLEERIELSKNTLYSWKKNTPKGSNLIKVADYFNVSTDYLLGRTSKKYLDGSNYAENDLDKKLHEIFNGLNNQEKEFLLLALNNTLELARSLAKK
ncbi:MULTISPECIES: helix-turn-helix domain-containing protein [Lysinibacillus]|uniref:helix-turn-helix domain-containing protein n=1 Tax=Lysinibacillus TaxID=400634 RepID=UPI0021A29063|nr:helix-turn-helix transcriptional regulator [Lysinibacillus capsici]MCT1538425.1 helix-turn-helix domain-containing protein [Lysinibacillus capsici]MCT1569133.1 helix-turn-helix domain-containing protein [Lysinibacillus capsici]MCT1646148.1 helix-turn-helix domain-containing protein [Lysinibacillus capsici]MCT1725346.1 helix-turn-helix domain-containing protein [Lysinibacillus capsici]MCT1784126.1 helix-turn-helix domain-containing protein [Lysinibacillus capsici]